MSYPSADRWIDGPGPSAPGPSAPNPSAPGPRRWIWPAVAVVVVLLVAIGVGVAVTLGRENTGDRIIVGPGASPSRPPGATATASPSASPSTSRPPTGPVYAVGSDLCGRISFTSLGSFLGRRPELTFTSQTDGVTCVYSTSGGDTRPVFTAVDVTATAYSSATDAHAGYESFGSFVIGDGVTEQPSPDTFDKVLSGYGDEASGYYQSGSTTGSGGPVPGDYLPPHVRTSYLIVLRKANVLLSVNVEVNPLVNRNQSYSRQTMRVSVGAEAKSIAALFHKA